MYQSYRNYRPMRRNFRQNGGYRTSVYVFQEQAKIKEQVINEFIKKKLSYIQEHLLIYEQEQDCRDSESIQLLKFKETKQITPLTENNQQIQLSKNEEKKEEQQAIDKKIAKVQQQMALFENIKSYVKKKLLLDNEIEEANNNLSSDQIFELRKEIFQKQFKNVDNLFNLNYLPEIKEKAQTIKCKELFNEFFEFEDINDEENLDNKIYSSFKFNYKYNFNTLNKKQLDFYLNINSLEQYSEYEDRTQTSLLEFNTPRYLTIYMQSDNLSLLTTIRILLSLKSYNTLNITIGGYSYQDSIQEQLIDTIFRIIFNQRSMQLLVITISQNLIKYVANGMRKANIERSNIRDTLTSSQCSNDFFEQLSRLQNLSHFEINKDVLINDKNTQSAHKILKNLIYANLSLIRTQLTFDSPKLERLELKYTFYSAKEININFENFKNASNLQDLKITYVIQKPPEQKPLINNGEISRKQIHQKSKEKKQKQNQLEDNDNQSDNFNDEKREIEEQKCEQLEEEYEEPIQPTLNEIKLDALIGLNQLTSIDIMLNHNQTVFSSFVNFLKQSTSIQNVNVKIHIQYTDKDTDKVDMNELLPVLDKSQSLKQFELNARFGQIRYNKQRGSLNQYSYYLKYTEDFTGYYDFKYFFFSFERVNEISLDIYKETALFYLFYLDLICQSVSLSTDIEKFLLKMSFSTKFLQKIEKNQYDDNDFYELFSHLSDLEKLNILEILIPFNQNVIDQLSVFIKQSQSIKSLLVQRTILRQFYLNYTQLFQSISHSQTLEQLSLDFGIEQMNIQRKQHISIWEETKMKFFYTPFCEMLKDSQKCLQLIQFHEKFYKNGIESILKSLLTLNHTKYIKFTLFQIYDHLNENDDSEEFTELVRNVYDRGFLVNMNYQFQQFYKFSNKRKTDYSKLFNKY